MKTVDVIIVGSGIAGLMTAHLLADHMNVMLITKSGLRTSNSSCAQGGMAAALSSDDDWKIHLADTLNAGQHHHNESHAEMLVKRAPAIVHLLAHLGVPFDKNEDGSLILGMEGAHQKRRIVHVNGDKTGQAFTEALINVVKERIAILEHTLVTTLLEKNNQVIGVQTNTGRFYAKSIVLATGGLGQLYEHTSNVEESTGDGYALAYRVGAVLKDMEFIQFHPTLLKRDTKTFGLISEAVRGEGAKLVTNSGERLMDHYPLKELEARDVVSREIHRVLQEGNEIYLDCRNIDEFTKRFPGLAERCVQAGINPEITPLSVVPGAHFASGGIETDKNGCTSVLGLYAIGEVACTGVHGANRLASNSLLEGFVFAEKVAAHILNDDKVWQALPPKRDIEDIEWKVPETFPSKKEIQINMTKYVGIERDQKGLNEMKKWLEPYRLMSSQICQTDSQSIIERKNMILVACLITEAAFQRMESRGGHYRKDFPERDDHYWLGKQITLSLETGPTVTEIEKNSLLLEKI